MNSVKIIRENGIKMNSVIGWNIFFNITILEPTKFTIWNLIKARIEL